MRILSLDKWLKPKKDPDKSNKSEDISKTPQKKQKSDVKPIEAPNNSLLIKFELTCSNSKCKYKKLLKKKQLKEKDKICPRCRSNMIEKKK